MLDFIGFIATEVTNLTTAQKTALLSDFCSQYGYQELLPNDNGELTVENPVTKKQFANSKIVAYIKETVNAYRSKVAKEAITIEELELEN